MSKQQKSIKLKLEQPAIMCSGRKKVECYYRGKVVAQSCDFIMVEFKSYGELQEVKFDVFSGDCMTYPWQDLKIVE